MRAYVDGSTKELANIKKKYKKWIDGYIVLDELAGMWISLILVPYRFEYFLMAFILFRYFDILKPSFIYRSQNINSSISVFVDDILAGILTFLIMYSVIYIL